MIPFVGHFVDGPKTRLDKADSALGRIGENGIVASLFNRLSGIANIAGKAGPVGAVVGTANAMVKANTCINSGPGQE
jgi:hypothetical protein